jgi:23S rRNA G2069 N7-methylase RlmK/C1962 C5-methylase RlmI
MSDPAPVALGNRIRKNRRRLRAWLGRTGTTCYRVYDRDIPEIPLVVDVYEGRLHVAEVDRPHDRTPEAHGAWLEALVVAAAGALDVDPDEVWLKRRARQRGTAQYTRFSRAGARFVVSEGGHRFHVNLSDYLDTWLFLDHRRTRALFAAEAAGKRVLNLFAYTGAFSVYAAAAGARSTTTVDLSKTYLEIAAENLELNGLAGPQHRQIRADATTWLTDPDDRSMFDLCILDPPTFSNSSAMAETFDVQRDHVALVESTLDRLVPGGVLWFSTNRRKFKPALDRLRCEAVEEVTEQTIDEDFGRGRPHRCWRIVR